MAEPALVGAGVDGAEGAEGADVAVGRGACWAGALLTGAREAAADAAECGLLTEVAGCAMELTRPPAVAADVGRADRVWGLA